MTIGEVSRRLDIPIDTLRYYEKIGVMPRIPRNASGLRNYGEEHISRLEFTLWMRNAGLPLETLKRYFQLMEQGDHTLQERQQLLREQRDHLRKKADEILLSIDKLEHKMEVYDRRLQELGAEE